MSVIKKYKYYVLIPVIIFVLFMILMFFLSGSDESDPFVYQFF